MLSRSIQIKPGTIPKGGIMPRPSVLPVIPRTFVGPGSGRSEVTPRTIAPVTSGKMAPVETLPVEPSKPFYKNPLVLIGGGLLIVFLLMRKRKK